MKKYTLFCCALLTTLLSYSQNKFVNQKVFLITLDGLRWQELFTGADSLLVSNKNYVKNPEKLLEWSWNEKPKIRRMMLMPFIWDDVVNTVSYTHLTLPTTPYV